MFQTLEIGESMRHEVGIVYQVSSEGYSVATTMCITGPLSLQRKFLTHNSGGS